MHTLFLRNYGKLETESLRNYGKKRRLFLRNYGKFPCWGKDFPQKLREKEAIIPQKLREISVLGERISLRNYGRKREKKSFFPQKLREKGEARFLLSQTLFFGFSLRNYGKGPCSSPQKLRVNV